MADNDFPNTNDTQKDTKEELAPNLDTLKILSELQEHVYSEFNDIIKFEWSSNEVVFLVEYIINYNFNKLIEHLQEVLNYKHFYTFNDGSPILVYSKVKITKGEILEGVTGVYTKKLNNFLDDDTKVFPPNSIEIGDFVAQYLLPLESENNSDTLIDILKNVFMSYISNKLISAELGSNVNKVIEVFLRNMETDIYIDYQSSY